MLNPRFSRFTGLGFPLVFSLFSLVSLVSEPSALAADKPTTLPPPPSPPSSSSSVGKTTTTSAYSSESMSSSYGGSTSDKQFYAAPMLGYGTDELNFGLGIRGGKMITDRISIGGLFVYHFGDSTTAGVQGPGVNVQSTASLSFFYLGPEAGYDFRIAPVLVRPYAGLGLLSINASTSTNGTVVTSGSAGGGTKFVVWPGCQVIYDMPETNFFVGGDTRFVTVPGGPSFGIFAMGGMKL
jgi:hypothetical protein